MEKALTYCCLALQAVVTLEQHHFFADVSRLDPPPPCIILPSSLAAHPSGRMVLCRMSDAGMPLHLVLQQLPYLRSPKAAIDGPRELLRWWRLKHFSSSQLQKAVSDWGLLQRCKQPCCESTAGSGVWLHREGVPCTVVS
jgi:hypothetical protein